MSKQTTEKHTIGQHFDATPLGMHPKPKFYKPAQTLHTTIDGADSHASIEEFISKIQPKTFWYEVVSGNNPRVIERVIDNSFRGKFWRNIKNPVEVSRSEQAQLNFKWSPCSIRQDFLNQENKQTNFRMTHSNLGVQN